MPGKNRIDNRGMSLVEIMVALTILLVVIIAIVSMFFHASMMSKQEQALTRATQLAVSQIEFIKQNIVSGRDFDDLENSKEFFFSKDPDYVYEIEIDTISASLKYIGVTVYYNSGNKTNPEPNHSMPNLGKITTMGTFINRP
jgi:Tfp pilus assembly protein PilV